MRGLYLRSTAAEADLATHRRFLVKRKALGCCVHISAQHQLCELAVFFAHSVAWRGWRQRFSVRWLFASRKSAMGFPVGTAGHRACSLASVVKKLRTTNTKRNRQTNNRQTKRAACAAACAACAAACGLCGLRGVRGLRAALRLARLARRCGLRGHLSTQSVDSFVVLPYK